MKVTVYLPTKDRRPLLQRAVQSVLEQSYSDIELIVVDDGSTDGTQDYLRHMDSLGKLRAILNRRTYGACHSRNAALEIAQGHFVTGLDDDDFFLPNRVGSFVKQWEDITKSRGGGIAGLFDQVILRTGLDDETLFREPVVTARMLSRKNVIGNQVFAPKAHYEQAGFFDVQMPAWQDWDLWLRMAEKFGPFINIEHGTYIVVPDATSAQGAIRNKPDFVIRYASQLFAYKHKLNSRLDKAALAENLLHYPQVVPSWSEFVSLLVAGKSMDAMRAARKKLRSLRFVRGALRPDRTSLAQPTVQQ